MKRTTSKILTMTCGLALVVSTLVGSACARGSGSGHSSGGSHHFSNRMTSSNFSRGTRINGSNHVNNFKLNTSHHRSATGGRNGKFVGNKVRSQRFATRRFVRSSSPFWKKYGNWGTYCGCGWGWGSWYSPCCCGWACYEPIPVVDYYNPYCACAGNIVDGVDYSVPIAGTGATTADADDSDAFAAARAAYAQGDLNSALQAISVAAMQTPHDSDVHQFHSLVLFAMGNYCKSATVAHAVLEAGPGWTWDALCSFYPTPDIYTGQLRRLEHFVSDHPSEADVRFLLGYHYLMLDHGDSAERQLSQVIALEPQDKLAANILTGLKKAAITQPGSAQPEPAKPAPVKRTKSRVATADSQTVPETTATDVPVSDVPVLDVTVTEKTVTEKPVTEKTVLAKKVAAKQTSIMKTLATPTPPNETAPQTPTAVQSTDDAGSEEEPIVDATPVVAREELVADAEGPAASNGPLTGTWKANPTKAVQIEVTLRDDKTFTWKFTTNGKTQSFAGKYVLGDKSLLLTREDGESMDGTLEREKDGSFKFRMKDADSDDLGLTFSR